MVCSATVLKILNFSKTVVETSPKMSHIGFGNKISLNATFIYLENCLHWFKTPISNPKMQVTQ